MDLLHTYASSSDDDNDQYQGNPTIPSVAKRAKNLNAAPLPSASALACRGALVVRGDDNDLLGMPNVGKSQQLILTNNPLKSELMKPEQGPAMMDPYAAKPLSKGVLGHRTAVHFDEVTFARERIAMERYGKARAPDADGTVVQSLSEYSAEDLLIKNAGRKRKLEILASEQKEGKGPLLESEDPDEDEATYGIWGPPTKAEREWEEDKVTDSQAGTMTSEQIAERDFRDERAKRREAKEDNEAEQFDRMVERKMSHLLPPRMTEDQEAIEPTTKFHGGEEVDYRGKSWIEPPPGIKPDWDGDHECFAPKKCVHKFTGHNKGVQRVRFFPGTGHLILSAGLDGKCKVWSMYDKRQCMRTYIGHSAAVRDVQFNEDGTKFLSASFDRYIRLWETESGKVLNTFTNRRVPYVVKFYPKDNNLFVVGMSDNKIVTFDSSTGEITQEYNHHLAPVNTITFCEDASKMVTSSDDKKVLVWEWDIGVPIKYISEPGMHSMPVITKHPSDRFWAGQSLDNQIVVYQAGDRFAQQRKKKFSGHSIAGYACDIAFSPNGKYIASGDGNGKLFIWDWKTGRNSRRFKAHDRGPTIGCAWSPIEPSTVVTCGWDAIIKVWE